jgi:hypothetical protein
MATPGSIHTCSGELASTALVGLTADHACLLFDFRLAGNPVQETPARCRAQQLPQRVRCTVDV